MMNPYKLISELYRILGETDEATLISAKELTLPPEMRRVIDHLCRLQRAMPSRGGLTPPENERTNQIPPIPPIDAGQNSGPLEYLRERKDITSQRLASILSRCGIKIQYRPKEGKAELLNRATRLLAEMSPDRQIRILTKVKKMIGVDETSGWMTVIRSSVK